MSTCCNIIAPLFLGPWWSWKEAGIFYLKEGTTMKRLIMVSVVAAVFMFALSVPAVMAQPVDYCEGNGTG